jgi:hypothetical protein
MIDMNRKLTIALSLLVLLGFSLVTQTLAQTRVPGVFEGNYFTYTLTASWSSTHIGATVPGDLLAINDTFWYNCTVLEVSGSNVSTTDVWHYVNGTENTAVVVQDVDSGTSFVMKGLINIVGANLGPNDPLYSSVNDSRRINQTVSIDYGSGKRDTNAVFFSYPITDSSGNIVGSGNEAYYFDKATGMLVARSENSVDSGGNVSIVILLANTNRWLITAAPSIVSPTSSPPTSDTLVAIIIVIIMAAVVAPLVLYKTRRNRKKKHRR